MRSLFIVLAAVTVVVAACNPAAAPTIGPSTSSPAASGPAGSAEPTTTAGSTSPSTPPLGRGDAASVAVDGLELSVAPEAGSSPAGSLARGAVAFIAEVRQAEGGTWLQLLPLDPAGGPESGWTLTQGDGSAGLTRVELGCDAIGVDAARVATMSPGLALACYHEPFTIEAWIIDCNCDIDGGYVDPEWLGTTVIKNPATGQPTTALLVNPGSPVPGDPSEWLMVHLDPAGDYPDPLPFGQDVLVTGSFDHPAAASCKAPPDVEIVPEDPVLYCRTAFAITAIKLAP